MEIPLLQRFILYLGNPAYAVTAVLFALLLFSGLGSRFAANLSLPTCLAALTVCILGMPVLLPMLFDWTLGFPLAARLGITLIALAPLGFLMGIHFPGGIFHLLGGLDQSASLEAETAPRSDIPWI